MVKEYHLGFGSIVVMLVLSVVLVGHVNAAGIGTSQINLNTTSVEIGPGGSASVGYTVQLTSGTTWGTSISASNASQFSSEGISVSFSVPYGDPTYSGTMTIAVSNSAKPGIYNITLQATGDDPSTSSAIVKLTVLSQASSSSTAATTTVTAPAIPTFLIVNKVTKTINASIGANISIGNLITAYIRPGTYVLINGNIISQYNFSLVLMSDRNVTSPPNESSYTPGGAYAFEVDNLITPSIEFVNASGKPYPIISTVRANSSTTTWTFLGGAFNGTTYRGGKYAFADTWNHINATTMVNTQFFKPVVWVFESKIAQPTTTPSTTSILSTTTIPPAASAPSYTLYYVVAVIIVIILIIAVIAFLMRRK